MALLETLSPQYIGEDRITLTLSEPAAFLLAFTSFQVDIDYAGCDPEGVVLPLKLIFQGPKPGSYQERIFRTAAPRSLVLTPKMRGEHLILLREMAHNRWQGRLFIDVAGDDLNIPSR